MDINRRPTIQDLRDMHIIPYDYLDELLEAALVNHQHKMSRMMQYPFPQRLQHHLPVSYEQSAVKWVVSLIYEDPTNDAIQSEGTSSSSWDSDDIEMLEKLHNLDRKIANRPSMKQMEEWGIVPPNYFQNPVNFVDNCLMCISALFLVCYLLHLL